MVFLALAELIALFLPRTYRVVRAGYEELRLPQDPRRAPALAPQLCTKGGGGVLLNTLINAAHLVFGQTTILGLKR